MTNPNPNINDFGRNSFVTHTVGLVERIKMVDEHLFKLKKDGKAVGYERYVYCDQRDGYLKGQSLVPQHSKDGTHWEHIYEWELKTCTKSYWFEAHLNMDAYIEHDEKCPFVTKNKNGKDVSVGDKVKANGIIAIVMWDAINCKYMLSTFPDQLYYPPALYDNMGVKFVWYDIELIEDKEE